MKTMSWSRYHCLLRSFLRIRTDLRSSSAKQRKRRTLKPASPSRDIEPRLGDPPAVTSCAAEGTPVAIPSDELSRTKTPRTGTDI